MVPFPNPVLYQNPNRTIILLDIPASIASAQGNPDHPNNYTLLSSEPQEEPYITNEPKSEKARQKLQQNTVDAQLHEEYRALTEESLAEIRMHHSGKWCLPRKFSPDAAMRRGKKRKAHALLEPKLHHEGGSETVQAHAVFDLQQELSILECALDIDGNVRRDGLNILEQISPRIEVYRNGDGQWNGVCRNNHAHPMKLTLASVRNPRDTATFRIPPHSSFLLGKCDSISTLPSLLYPEPNRSVGRSSTYCTSSTLHSTHPPPSPKFTLILLDPPWPNRSVGRSSAYRTSSTLQSTRTLLTSLNLPPLPLNGYIAIWTTNKASFRHLVLSPTDGLFATWNVALQEEWLWVKVTANGSPIMPLDGLWRKPYEVLLIGQSRCSGTAAASHRQTRCPGEKEVKMRVIAAVPDLHSRKPCLKQLFQQILLSADGIEAVPDHGVLEMFARNLVAGWSSCGDEVLKFNQETWWSLDDTSTSG